MGHFIEELRIRFPRLQEVSLSECTKDEYTVEDTPAGQIETVYFYERSDFEKAVIALAYKNEPRDIPPSIGAIFLNGLVDHVKMEKVALIILSRGGYSGISCGQLSGKGYDFSEEQWEAYSLTIRKYHEMAHFIQRKLFPENKDALKDEIKADMAGIVEAFGSYDGCLARLFLGIEESGYRKGGRLENYVADISGIDDACDFVESYIASLESRIGSNADNQSDMGYKNHLGFDILIQLEESERAQGAANAGHV